MNPRIKELADKAGVFVGDFAGAGMYSIHNQDEVEIFAESLIRECIKQIKTQGISASSEDYGDYEIGFNAGVFHALYTIKQHFGIDE